MEQNQSQSKEPALGSTASREALDKVPVRLAINKIALTTKEQNRRTVRFAQTQDGFEVICVNTNIPAGKKERFQY